MGDLSELESALAPPRLKRQGEAMVGADGLEPPTLSV